MPGASLPSTDGLADWIDNTHNWRAEDAEFLQSRTILRFSSESIRNSYLGPSTSIPSPTTGTVTFISGTNKLQYATSAGQWRDIAAYQYLTVDDGSTSVGMRLSSTASNSLSLESSKAVLGINRILTVNPTSVDIKTGSATASLTTNASFLVSSIGLSAPASAFTSITTSGIDNGTSAITTGSVTASGSLTAGSISISGTSVLGTATATSLTASAGVQGVTVYGTTSVRGGSVLLSGTKVSANGAPSSNVELESSYVKIAGDAVVISPTSSTTPIRYNNASGPIVPLIVVSASDPGAANYPEGTLWIRPS